MSEESIFKFASFRNMPLFAHQGPAIERMLAQPRMFDASDAGTGKTRTALEVIKRRPRGERGQTLILAPKSILQAAWGDDIQKFTPELEYVIATAKNRQEAFDRDDVDIIVTNHDAVKWIIGKEFGLAKFQRRFNQMFIDESTAFKHRTSQRSKAVYKLSKAVDYLYLMSGTPNPNTVLDLWHQYRLLDDGERLGANFFGFRFAVCTPTQTGPSKNMVSWSDKPGAETVVSDLVADITIRNRLEDCHSIPPNHMFEVKFELSPTHRRAYRRLLNEQLLELQDGDVTALNAGQITQKLLQLASGAVYDDERVSQTIANDRYELVLQLASEREQCIVAYNWTHQLDGLVAEAERLGMSYGYINGSVNSATRTKHVEDFQNGRLKVLFIHPQSGAHGLTLTRGTTTIWASPTHNAEHFEQLNRRIYRAGQTRRTETILVSASDTLESDVYERLHAKRTRMNDLLSMLHMFSRQAA